MIRACSVAELPEGEAIRLDGPVPISVFHAEGRYFAIDDTCTHQDASLADGWIEGCAVECPLHAARFDLRTGEALSPPANDAVRTYPIVIADGAIYVDTGTRQQEVA